MLDVTTATGPEIEEALRVALIENRDQQEVGRLMGELNRRSIARWQQENAEGRGTPYPWCLQPEVCRGRSCCPRDPNCGD